MRATLEQMELAELGRTLLAGSLETQQLPTAAR